MITENFIKSEIERLEAWIGRKLDGRFINQWLEECERMDKVGFLKAIQAFRQEDYFPPLRDFKSAYARAVGISEEEIIQGCDWCDNGVLVYLEGNHCEYLARCAICNMASHRYSKLPLVHPERPQYKLHPCHEAKKVFFAEMRARGEDPHRNDFTQYSHVSKVNPFNAKPDPTNERERKKNLARDEARDR
ncbi:MAG: hypothetical protein CL489_01675 [Acidobacteria bacterium]|nr:hypothetical protein [Acidobacteriota bacterium]